LKQIEGLIFIILNQIRINYLLIEQFVLLIYNLENHLNDFGEEILLLILNQNESSKGNIILNNNIDYK
jgi:hypothetical protein